MTRLASKTERPSIIGVTGGLSSANWLPLVHSDIMGVTSSAGETLLNNLEKPWA